MQQKIITITGKLLNSGCFNHLPDDEVVTLYHCMMQATGNIPRDTLLHLVDYWYKADFSENDSSFILLQDCNVILQSIGMPMIEQLMEEMYE